MGKIPITLAELMQRMVAARFGTPLDEGAEARRASYPPDMRELLDADEVPMWERYLSTVLDQIEHLTLLDIMILTRMIGHGKEAPHGN